MNSCQKYFSAGLLALLTQAAFAQSPPPGGGSGFAVLANTAVTCTDGTISGEVGTFAAPPTGSVTLTGCPITGTPHVGDAAATQAFNEFLVAYDALAPRPGDVCTTLTGTLAGMTLAPGAYCFDAAATLTGVLTLNGGASDAWLFKVGTGGTGALTGTSFSVVMAGGADACRVLWWVAEAATMTDSNLKGTLLAGAATTLTRGTLIGADFAKADATVTGTSIIGCEAPTVPGPGPGPKPGKCSDRVTGGGYLKTAGHHGKANFGVTAGMSRKGTLRGHLTYLDKGADLKVKGTGVTAYVVVDADTRHIEGTALINGVAGTYVLDVTDDGEGRRSRDSFAITLSSGYSASGTLAGGNIQLHKRHCDKGNHGHHGHDHDDDHDDDDDDGDDRDDHGKGDGKTHKPYGSDSKKHK